MGALLLEPRRDLDFAPEARRGGAVAARDHLDRERRARVESERGANEEREKLAAANVMLAKLGPGPRARVGSLWGEGGAKLSLRGWQGAAVVGIRNAPFCPWAKFSLVATGNDGITMNAG